MGRGLAGGAELVGGVEGEGDLAGLGVPVEADGVGAIGAEAEDGLGGGAGGVTEGGVDVDADDVGDVVGDVVEDHFGDADGGGEGDVKGGGDLLALALEDAHLRLGAGSDLDVGGVGGEQFHALHAGPDGGVDGFGRAHAMPMLDFGFEEAADGGDVVGFDEFTPVGVGAQFFEEDEADEADDDEDDGEGDGDAFIHVGLASALLPWPRTPSSWPHPLTPSPPGRWRGGAEGVERGGGRLAVTGVHEDWHGEWQEEW